MIFPEDYVVPFVLFLVVAFATFMFVHAIWEEREAKRHDVIREQVKDWVAALEPDSHIAVHRNEWRWVVNPWPKKPWMGTKYEAQYEDTFE